VPFQRVADILDRIRGLHREFQHHYAQNSRWQSDERLALLLENMARQEGDLASSLASFDAEAQSAVRETWLQYVPLEQVTRVLDDIEPDPQADIESVIADATALDAALVDAYRILASSNAPPRVRELFANLVEMEQRKGKQRSLGTEELFESESVSND
jgi:hypothetical protein